MTTVALDHCTRYRYDRAVTLSPHVIRLRPAPHARVAIERYSLTITPNSHTVRWHQDVYGNCLAGVTFDEPTRELRIDVALVAQLHPQNPFDFLITADAERMPFSYDDEERRALTAYLDVEAAGPRLAAWIARARERLPLRTVDFVVDVNRELADAIEYERRLEPGVRVCEETLREGRGSCRDSTWLLVQIMRHCGLAARFVSGYLIQLAAETKSRRGRVHDVDSGDFHAWCEVYLPGAGWMGLDPTSGLAAAEGHIPLACAALPEAAAPVSGYAERSGCELSYDVTVSRITSHP